MDHTTRRSFLRATGVAALAGVAGCGGDSGDGGDTGRPTVAGSEYPAVDEWLTGTEGGGSAGNYDGTLLDLTGQETVTVDVGAQGNGGAFAFAPAAVVVSTGTTVEWSWTGEGTPHNVEAVPGEQLGESDYEFSSGEAEGGSGVKFSQTMDRAGVALYHCEPHLSLGMKGGVAVR